MFIKEIKIQNFRLFDADTKFTINDINIPNGNDRGSGLTVFVGENACGKTSLLDAMSLPLLSFKADSFSIYDFNDPNKKSFIELLAEKEFEVAGAMPKGSFKSKGFEFEAGLRSRGNKAYLSSIVVSDQKYIKADGQPTPKDGSPDLRLSVNNPFKGKRFDENDILFLDKSRTFQTRSGTYNATRFDRLMEDFDYQYIKKQESIKNLNENFNEIKKDIEHVFLAEAVKTFNELSGAEITLNMIDNWRPFNKGFFAEKKDNNLQVNLNMMGSGYEMIFSLVYSFSLAKQSGKQLIAFLDEPELHLHPSLQSQFVKFLLEISKESQIILTSHSPLFIKQLSCNKNVCIKVFKKVEGMPQLLPMDERVLPYVSANEINFLAFGLPTVEFHNELYGYLQPRAIDEDEKNYYEKDFDSYLQAKDLGLYRNKWIKVKQDRSTEGLDRTVQTYIRNQIHHPENEHNKKYTDAELKGSINEMIKLLRT
jgi:predicted ATP-dependent endonuclease of OLD family